ncbi:MAG TPA: porin, partial [Flavobacteriales bacterium]|nr:porin [Flavobacteriales bacterium]
MKRFITAVILLGFGCVLRGQSDSIAPGTLKFTGYVDVYYAFDFAGTADDDRPSFLYQYDRHNEVDLNLG